MNCFKQTISCFAYSLESLGLYEPEIDFQEASDRLRIESQLWQACQRDRDEAWNGFQANKPIACSLSPLVQEAIAQLDVEIGVAVDLGCGINSTVINLLERGWTVYAVDSSNAVLQSLAQKVSKTGIDNGKLILVNKTIEKFEFPEKVHLVIATDSLPYCNPNKIYNTFCNIKNALHPQGVFVCSLFPYENTLVDKMLRGMFGAWMTTRNVTEALMRSTDFSTWSVTEGKSPGGLARQFHILAKS